jgi:hypothetical protein
MQAAYSSSRPLYRTRLRGVPVNPVKLFLQLPQRYLLARGCRTPALKLHGGAVGALALLLDVFGDERPHLVLLRELGHALIQLTQLVRAEGRKRVNQLLEVSAAHGAYGYAIRQHAKVTEPTITAEDMYQIR